MHVPKNILVPVDFGMPSLRACDRAVALAKELAASLTLLHVVDFPIEHLTPMTMDHLRASGERTMAEHAAVLRPHVHDLRTRVLEGVPWRVLVEQIEAGEPELVVIGTHGRRGLSRPALGSVAERIVRMSPCPVLTVPAYAFDTREDAGRRLARELLTHELSNAPAVVAVTRGAIPVADRISAALDTTLDVWSAVPIVISDRAVGTMGEDELAYYDDGTERPSVDRASAESRALDEVREEARALRGSRTIGSVSDRLVVLVSDGLASASPVISAVRALRLLRPSGFLLATPIATPEALADVRAVVDETLCLDAAYLAGVVESSYRRGRVPSYRESRNILGTLRMGSETAAATTRHA